MIYPIQEILFQILDIIFKNAFYKKGEKDCLNLM